ncbi:unnamed protein product [Prunus brigantina]
MASQDELDHGDSESRQNASHKEEEHASEGTFTLTNLVAAIHVMGETQREIVDTIKELKSSVSKPSEENERPPQEESAAGGKDSKQKGPSHPRSCHCHAREGAKLKPGGLEVCSSAIVSIKPTPAALS